MDTNRVQLALNVSDIAAATEFYTAMFGTPPAKVRPGYANFAISDPPLKLVLFENPGAESALNHLGVEVRSTAEVSAAAERFATAGLRHRVTESDQCCHAVQDKVWVDAPDVPLGAWEVYTVVADVTEGSGTSPASTCCSTDGDTTSACCVSSPSDATS